MTRCTGEPISWLRLERYGLRELPEPEHDAIAAHLRECPACESCFARVAADGERIVPALTPTSRAAARSERTVLPRLRGHTWAALGLASAAIAVLSLRVSGPGLEPPVTTRAIKGGELALELVRLGADGRLRDPTAYAEGDLFKLTLTCPEARGGVSDLVVYQDGHAFFPWPAAQPTTCGNRRSLAGAFSIGGTSEATVCVVLSDRAPDRSELARGPHVLPERSACVKLPHFQTGR